MNKSLKKNILVTGAGGQLGKSLQDLTDHYHQHFNFTFKSREALDICDAYAVGNALVGQDVVINCAAYTQVDLAETEKKQAWKMNAEGPKLLAEMAEKYNAKLIHISTDYVFDGTSSVPYTEDAPTSPINYYGETKLAGEHVILDATDNAIIVRTSWLYSPYRNNFIKTMMRLGRERKQINVVNDQIGSPTSAHDLAKAILQMCRQITEQELKGIYHYCNEGRVSWYELAQEIMKTAGLECVVLPVDSDAYKTAANRPRFSLLNTDKIQEQFGVVSPHWKDSLKICVNKLLMQERLKQINMERLIEIAQAAGDAIMEVYNTDFEVEYKEDESPLTIADQKSNDVIIKGLQELEPDISILSEETKNAEYAERKDWEYLWIVDPLDGTKEFVKRNGEFTVNIALVHNGAPVLGVIYAPVLKQTFYATKGSGAFKIEDGRNTQLRAIPPSETETVYISASRSHLNEDTQKYVDEKRAEFNKVEFISAGSSLKFCLVAEGKAQMYPRFAPTMEWDTAAGHIIAQEAGAKVLKADTQTPLIYNKEDLLNPYFWVVVE